MEEIVKLNGTIIKKPKDFQIGSYNLTKSGRVASGKMTMDIIAKKRKFTFKYDILGGPHLRTILGIIDGMEPFFTIDYIDDNEEKTAIVYVGDINKTIQRTGSVWYWKDVTFDLIEQ